MECSKTTILYPATPMQTPSPHHTTPYTIRRRLSLPSGSENLHSHDGTLCPSVSPPGCSFQASFPPRPSLPPLHQHSESCSSLLHYCCLCHYSFHSTMHRGIASFDHKCSHQFCCYPARRARCVPSDWRIERPRHALSRPGREGAVVLLMVAVAVVLTLLMLLMLLLLVRLFFVVKPW